MKIKNLLAVTALVMATGANAYIIPNQYDEYQAQKVYCGEFGLLYADAEYHAMVAQRNLDMTDKTKIRKYVVRGMAKDGYGLPTDVFYGYNAIIHKAIDWAVNLNQTRVKYYDTNKDFNSTKNVYYNKCMYKINNEKMGIF